MGSTRNYDIGKGTLNRPERTIGGDRMKKELLSYEN